jgi:pantoate--beta-alanine ligase
LSYSEIVIARKVSKIFKKIFISLKRKFKNNKKILFYLDKIRLVSSEIEYFDIRNKNNLTLKCNRNNFKIFIAYKINHIRLIDNI